MSQDLRIASIVRLVRFWLALMPQVVPITQSPSEIAQSQIAGIVNRNRAISAARQLPVDQPVRLAE